LKVIIVKSNKPPSVIGHIINPGLALPVEGQGSIAEFFMALNAFSKIKSIKLAKLFNINAFLKQVYLINLNIFAYWQTLFFSKYKLACVASTLPEIML
jgi:hypothetical protein